jgi:hypothetical protein
MSNWTEILAKSDLNMAREEIIGFHQLAQREAEREGADAYFDQAYIRAWEGFRDSPTVENAAALLNVAPMLAQYFEGCSPGGQFYEINKLLRRDDP